MPNNEETNVGDSPIVKLIQAGDFSNAEEIAMEISNEEEKEKALDLIATAKRAYISKKIDENEWLAEQVREHPVILERIEEVGEKIFNFPELLSAFVEEVLLKEEADNISRTSLKNRLETEPLASDEEIEAGVYWENLEPQVKEAIINLRRKNYNTFESGFESYRLGAREQFFSIFKGATPLTISEQAINIMKAKGITIRIENDQTDRNSLFMISDKKMTLGDWQEIWNLVAEILPAMEKAIDLPEQAVEFQKNFKEKQKRLRLGESVYIAYDFWLEGGKLVEK